MTKAMRTAALPSVMLALFAIYARAIIVGFFG